MSPPVEEWPANQLPVRVYGQADGKRRKPTTTTKSGTSNSLYGLYGSNDSRRTAPASTPDTTAGKEAAVSAFDPRTGEIDLRRCPLYELVQYACESELAPGQLGARGKQLIRCEQIVRTFRKCEQFTAEVTALPDLQRS